MGDSCAEGPNDLISWGPVEPNFPLGVVQLNYGLGPVWTLLGWQSLPTFISDDLIHIILMCWGKSDMM